MKDEPLVSVVLPVYNCALYIEDAVNSILMQTFTDFELLIIDDCSTDNTIELIELYQDSRIIIKKKGHNKGLIDSLNYGFEIARGKYIARMDGDDISAVDRFQKQYDILENNPEIDVCGCWLQEFGKKHRIIQHKQNHEQIAANMLLSCSMTMGSVMLNRKAVEGYKFDENKKHVEDYDFWSRIAWSCTFYNIQEVLYYYRMHETQVSTIHKPLQVQGDIAIKLFLFKKLKYNADFFTDSMIAKTLLLNEHITLDELDLFIKWLKELILINRKTQVYSQKELESVLGRMKYALLFTIYFEKTEIGIHKKWRSKALFRLPIKDTLWILNIKKREIFKTIFIK
jgi:glycosyltransferase involved in cell wall biosynthesis